MCSYCAIPLITGRHTSRPKEEILAEVRWLVSQGVKELNVIAQDLSSYGLDLVDSRKSKVERHLLPELIDEIAHVPGVEWIRLHYAYPTDFPEDLLDVMARNSNVCKYLDIALQHCTDHMLGMMRRHITRAEQDALIRKIRARVPGICIRTTLITGFPGETEDDVNILADFMEEQRFDRLGVFTYSAEEDTAAAEFEGQIEEEEKQNRLSYLMELQQQIAFEKAQSQVGKDLIVMIEGRLTDETETADHTWQYTYVARSYMDAPDIDGLVFVEADAELMSGDFARVRITEARDYDLVGVLADVVD
jgi:ribosomal protein S12 methylthiotransferase